MIADTQSKRHSGQPRKQKTGLNAKSDVKQRISDFQPNPLNPRKITDEQLEALKAAMMEFGDLSGLVVNLTTGHMVGGHQRVKILGEAPIEIQRRFAKPTPRGTVAEGVVVYNGERFVYREVRWTEAQEKAAMIAANKHGGDWDLPGLSELLMELDSGGYELMLTGFSAKELEQMLTKLTPDVDEQPGMVAATGELLPAHIRMVQLFLTVETLPPFMEWVKALESHFGTTSITDTVCRAVEECYKSKCGDTQPAPALAPESKQRAKGRRRVQLDTASVGAEA
jgi:hypothetical protein